MRDWLYQKRTQLKLTQNDVALKCSFSRNFYNMIELGKRNPSPKIAKKIAKILNFDWTLFFE